MEVGRSRDRLSNATLDVGVVRIRGEPITRVRIGEIEDVAADVRPESVPSVVREDEEDAARRTGLPRIASLGAVLGADCAHVNLSDSDGGLTRITAAPAGID